MNKKATPNIRAVLLKTFFSMAKFRPRYDDTNSDVTIRTSATTVKTRLMSQKERGNCISSFLYMRAPSFSEKHEYT